MNTQNASEKEKTDSGDGNMRKEKKRTIVYDGLDWDKIENAPITELEREIREKIAVVPSPSEILIEEEKRILFRQACRKAGLSHLQKRCLKHFLRGRDPLETALILKVHPGTVKQCMARIKGKLKKLLSSHPDLAIELMGKKLEIS